MTLQIDKIQTIEGITVYGDSHQYWTFYPISNQARYRRMPDKSLAFKFIKYRSPVDRGPDKPAGGGYLLFDTEFVIADAKLAAVREVLQGQVQAEANRRNASPVPEVKIGTITYTRGTVDLLFMGADGQFVKKFKSAGKPSMYGNNIASFQLELDAEGASLYESALQGSGGAVSVIYDLHHYARLPNIKVHAGFRASKFYSFYQTIDTDWNMWSEDEYRETVREQMISSESMYLTIDDGGATVDEETMQTIRDWAMSTLEEAVERNMIEAIAPVPDDQRDRPDGIEDVTRDITNRQISSFSLYFSEAKTVEWNIVPQGMLQNITSLKDGDGNLIKWEDYAQEIDLDDEFFRQLRVNTFVNADFDNLPIHSVEVKLLYNGRPMPNLIEGQPEGEAVLKAPGDMGKFATFVDSNNWDYTYSYQINYTGESRIFQSEEITTNEGILTIGVGDVGILSVDVSAGDLNWNDIERVAVSFEYEDTGAGVQLIKDQFILTKDDDSHQIQEVIFAPMRKNYEYRVKYFMKNGSELEGDTLKDRSPRLFINDVFGARKDVGVRGIGDFTNKISKIFVDLRYTDPANDYEQTHSQTLSASLDYFDWSIPVISATSGKVEYSANIVYTDGTNENIGWTEPETNTILLPPPSEDILEVTVVPDLLDWTAVRLARVDLSYSDPANNVSERKTFMFSSNRTTEGVWKIDLRDRDRNTYRYKATYFLADGTNVADGPHDTQTSTLILEVPA